MPFSFRLGLAACLMIPSLPAPAVDILPGLWEITPRGVQRGGQTLPDLARCCLNWKACLPSVPTD